MRTTIDAAGRLVVPMPLRRMLGFKPGVEVEVSAINGHLEVAIPSRVAVDEGPHGVRFVAEADEKLNARQVRELMEQAWRACSVAPATTG